jgi:hypothetical protein
MSNDFPSDSLAQRISRRLGWVLLLLHTIILASVPSSFGEKGSEWWPVIFFPIDFPISVLIFLFFKHVHSFSNWGTWMVFLAVGSIWQFYWPQALVYGFRRLAHRFRSKATLA